MTLEGDLFIREIGATDELITFRVTFRDVEWMIESFNRALYTLAAQNNWSSDPEDLGSWDEVIEDYVNDLLESVKIVDEVGQINAYCIADYTDLPVGILPCRGETYDKDEYPLLWERLPSSLKTETTLTTPDLRGHIIGASGSYPGLSTRAVLSRTGTETHTLVETEMPAHSHTYTPPTVNVDLETPGVPDIQAAGIGLPTQTGNTGGGQAHNNMQPTVFMVWGITAK